MRLQFAAAALCAFGIAMPAMAGDVEDVKAVVAKAEKAYNACNVATIKKLTYKEFFGFNPDGTIEEDATAEFKGECDKGTKYKFDITVDKVYTGDGWAVAAGKNKGKITPKDGKAEKVDAHWTAVMVKDGDTWKTVHLHASPNIMEEEGGE